MNWDEFIDMITGPIVWMVGLTILFVVAIVSYPVLTLVVTVGVIAGILLIIALIVLGIFVTFRLRSLQTRKKKQGEVVIK